jgi:hypothetical protein
VEVDVRRRKLKKRKRLRGGDSSNCINTQVAVAAAGTVVYGVPIDIIPCDAVDPGTAFLADKWLFSEWETIMESKYPARWPLWFKACRMHRWADIVRRRSVFFKNIDFETGVDFGTGTDRTAYHTIQANGKGPSLQSIFNALPKVIDGKVSLDPASGEVTIEERDDNTEERL